MHMKNNPPAIEREQWARFEKLSKAAWASIYFDLYRQCFGEETSDAEIMAEAESRVQILKDNGLFGSKS
jgi:hypothetical protein